MAVTHSAAALQAATNAVTALIGSSSKLVFRSTAGGTTIASPGAEVATLILPTGFAAAAVSGIASANLPITADTTATAGTVAYASLQSSTDVLVVYCSVTAPAGGGDIEMTNSLIVAANDTVSCSALTYRAISA